MVDRRRLDVFPDWRDWWRSRLATVLSVLVMIEAAGPTIFSFIAVVFSLLVVLATIGWVYTHLPISLIMFLLGVAGLFTLGSINANEKAILKRQTETPYERGFRRMVEGWKEEQRRRKES